MIMALNLLEIEKILRDSGPDKAREELELFLNENPDSAEGWYLMGGILRRGEHWGEAINALNKAKFLDPAGPAANAIEYIYEILNYRNNDYMNP